MSIYFICSINLLIGPKDHLLPLICSIVVDLRIISPAAKDSSYQQLGNTLEVMFTSIKIELRLTDHLHQFVV